MKNDKLWIGEHGRVGMWGPLITHTGLLLLGVGALIGSFGGITDRAGGFSGETITAKDVPGMPFAVRIDSFRIQYYPLQPGQMVLVEEALGGPPGNVSSRTARGLSSSGCATAAR